MSALPPSFHIETLKRNVIDLLILLRKLRDLLRYFGNLESQIDSIWTRWRLVGDCLENSYRFWSCVVETCEISVREGFKKEKNLVGIFQLGWVPGGVDFQLNKNFKIFKLINMI